MGAPLLILSPREATRLVSATASAVAAWQSGPDARHLPRVPEQVLVALVGELRAEDASPHGPGRARGRVRRASAVTGAFGPLGLVPSEVVGVIEQARAATDAARDLTQPRTDEQLAADLLVVWGLLPALDEAEAVTSGTSDRSLLEAMVAHGVEFLRDQIPERWTAWSALKLLWQLRQVPALRERLSASSLRSRGLRSVPVLGAVPTAFGAHREMRDFQARLAAHLGGAAAAD